MSLFDFHKNNVGEQYRVHFCSALMLLALACGCSSSYEEVTKDKILEISKVSSASHRQCVHGPIQPLYAAEGLDPKKVSLGRDLFHDARLSHDNTISCASCHNLSAGGADGRPFAIGINGQSGSLNTPTVFNSSLSVAQFWDGRAATLEEQVSGPVHNPLEMGSTWDEVILKLRDDPEFLKRFNDIYDGLNSEAIIDAIATFERTLVTVNSPFDQFLLGNEDAISEQAKKGHELFVDIGCTSCHQGQAIGGNLFQKFGVMKEYYHKDNATSHSDRGRLNVTEREVDLHRFKVPSLRNIEQTAPYFHNGSVEKLEEAVEIMAEHQLGMSLEKDETLALIEFLKSLTGNISEEI